MNKSGIPVRIGKKLRGLIYDTKNKNGISTTEASDYLADFFIEQKMKKQIKRKITKEIEF